MESSAAGSVPVHERRPTAFVVLTLVFGVVIGIGLFSLISLVVGWFEGGDRVIHRVHDLGYGASIGIWVATGFLVQARSPERKVAVMQQVALAIVAFAIAALLSAQPASLVFALLFAVAWAILYALHPARAEITKAGRGFSLALGGLTAAAAIPLVVFALRMASLQRNGPATDPHIEEDHWLTMAGLAIGIVFLGFLAAAKTRGWRIPAWSAGASAIVFGTASLVFPNTSGAASRGWALLLIAWAVVLIAVAEWEARRAPPRAAGP